MPYIDLAREQPMEIPAAWDRGLKCLSPLSQPDLISKMEKLRPRSIRNCLLAAELALEPRSPDSCTLPGSYMYRVLTEDKRCKQGHSATQSLSQNRPRSPASLNEAMPSTCTPASPFTSTYLTSLDVSTAGLWDPSPTSLSSIKPQGSRQQPAGLKPQTLRSHILQQGARPSVALPTASGPSPPSPSSPGLLLNMHTGTSTLSV